MIHCRTLLTGVLATLLTTGLANAAPTEIPESRNDKFEKGYPHQFESWKSTEEMDFKSKHLGNKMEDMLEKDPRLVVLWAGYGFSKDYNAPRGHMYAITDLRNTLRTGAPKKPTDGPMPNACWTCKGPDVTRLMAEQGEDYFKGKWASKGDQVVNSVGCYDCHDTKDDMKLRPGRSAHQATMQPNGVDVAKISNQDMKSAVCGQCHSEYYFAGKDKVVTFPTAKGTKVEDMEAYYDELEFKDWTHKISKAPMLKAQHPGIEVWKEGVHGRNNVSCADCHMPKRKEKGVTFTDHRVVSPLRDMKATCKTCHSQDEQYLLDVTYARQEQVEELKIKAEDAIVRAHIEAGEAWKAGATEAEMKKPLMAIRHAQWRWDYSIASHGASFHAPEEVLRILGTALEKAGEARVELTRILAKHGVNKEIPMPDLSSKAKAQAFIGLDMDKLNGAKEEFKKNTLPKWDATARENGLLK
ncbi:ammonia-forming cytochrome c nitrite reductase [Sansalvadorimonas sp. 2012CJ34-2]|uniref:Cytochrome c-552 n=1 Tax=Parendozoicomonas callyspongiae TaxID=2942213 RepID=A0ABT0PJV0_9GAMM|nr:ammonia-forming cytochrome c nitrite reductase [Sansalvadorimonas sp. 2012CJ34-2]MCL6271662.1 ammonia-forming cytochrome c nitrite reductase [Sansalvadorimonas sp. 2012CJ34-2]